MFCSQLEDWSYNLMSMIYLSISQGRIHAPKISTAKEQSCCSCRVQQSQQYSQLSWISASQDQL